jgi:hypothetical protein
MCIWVFMHISFTYTNKFYKKYEIINIFSFDSTSSIYKISGLNFLSRRSSKKDKISDNFKLLNLLEFFLYS